MRRLTFEAIPYNALCHLSTFTVNGYKATEYDFVDKYDHSPDSAEDYGCGNMQADIKEPTAEVLEKYAITEDEFRIIAEDVADKLSFGPCGWCV